MREGKKGSTHCKQCKHDYAKEYRKTVRYRTKDYARKSLLKRKYGIDQEVFEKMLADQDNKCLICSTEFIKTPALDHDHKTGRLRGVLCHKCNSGIGFFKDDPVLIQKAIDYLI